jgi:hypothetical protein
MLTTGAIWGLYAEVPYDFYLYLISKGATLERIGLDLIYKNLAAAEHQNASRAARHSGQTPSAAAQATATAARCWCFSGNGTEGNCRCLWRPDPTVAALLTFARLRIIRLPALKTVETLIRAVVDATRLGSKNETRHAASGTTRNEPTVPRSDRISRSRPSAPCLRRFSSRPC